MPLTSIMRTDRLEGAILRMEEGTEVVEGD